jgi:PAS domain S-box-containing protein
LGSISPERPPSDGKRLQLLIDAVTDFAIYMLDPQGQVSSWNAGAERITGYRSDDIIGQHFSVFFTPEDRQRGHPDQALAAARSAGRHETEGLRVRKDGSRFWAMAVVEAIHDDDGRFVGFAEVTRDVTEWRNAQQALEQTRVALAQSQKMEAIGQLTGGIAHDFNNLLTVITNNLDLIMQHGADPARIARLAQSAQRAAERGAKLTQQLLAFARRQSLRPEIVDPNTLIGAFEALLRRACGELVTVELELSREPQAVRIDPPQFEAALLNLAFNARDAMPRGGVMRISTELVEATPDDAAMLGDLRPGRYVLVSVQDTGVGMTPEIRARAFEPFFTTKEPGKGSGLGLSQVYGFVAQSGGHVLIDSTPDQGTVVRLYLPSLGSVGAASGKETAAKPRAGTVLVVEDDPDVLQSTVEMVRSFGYEVLTAGDAHAAIAVLKRNVPIDILFSDIVMPKGMNGVQLAKEARKLRPRLRVILSSGYATTILASEHGLTEDFAFIGKPYRWPDLAEKLRGARVH